MSRFTPSAVLAVFFGALLLPAMLVPYVAWTYRSRRTLGLGHAFITALTVVYGVAIWTYTIVPLPDASTLDCTNGGVRPQLIPFASLGDLKLAVNGLRDPMLVQLLANVALFVPFGMLVRHLTSWRRWTVIAAAAGLSLLIEATQLTGVWGLYPCAYRQFDVDDLLTNTTGALIGTALAPLLARIPGQDVIPSDQPRAVKTARRLVGMTVDLVGVHVVSLVIYLLLAVTALKAGWFGDDLPTQELSGWVTLTVSLVLLLALPRLGRGATLGQVLTFVRPITATGDSPGWLAGLRRWASGSGGYFALVALESLTGRDGLGTAATAWLIVSGVVVVVRHPRGVSGYASGLTVADARDHDPARSAAHETDPRSLTVGVVMLVVGLYLGVATLTVLGTLAPAVGSGIAVVGLAALGLATLLLLPYLVTNGVVMVRREGRSVISLLPLAAAAVLVALPALFAVALAADLAWLGALAAAGLAVTGYLGFLFIAFLVYGQWYARRAPTVTADAVVVLGSRVFGERVPPLLASRIDRGIAVLENLLEADPGSPAVLVCSGGQGPDEEMSEGEAMARYAIAHGAPDERVFREERSRTTQENLTFTLDLLKAHGLGTSLVVATNDFHAFRAAIIARELGVDAQVVGAHTARYYFPSATIREFVGVLARSPLFHAVVAGTLALLVGGVALLLLR